MPITLVLKTGIKLLQSPSKLLDFYFNCAVNNVWLNVVAVLITIIVISLHAVNMKTGGSTVHVYTVLTTVIFSVIL